MYGNNSYGSAPYSSKLTLISHSLFCVLLQRFPLMPSPQAYVPVVYRSLYTKPLPTPFVDVSENDADTRSKILIYLVENGLWTLEISKGV
jgi:hypothetical protein